MSKVLTYELLLTFLKKKMS